MQYLTLFSLAGVMMGSFLVSLGLLPGVLRFLPEMLSAVVTIFVLLHGVRSRFALVRPPYWIAFGAVFAIFACGIAANSVGPGPIISGFRFYFRAIPFFFLPLVHPFSSNDIRQQFTLVTGILLLQLPIAIYQRFSLLQESRTTGDFVYGTLMLSPTLTIVMVAAIGGILAMLIKGRLSLGRFVFLFLIFLIPTAINETKITVFFLPLSIISTLLIATPRGRRLRTLGAAVALITVAGALFIPLYDYFGTQGSKDENLTIADMFTKKDFFSKYLNQDTSIGDRKEVGRVDGFMIPLTYISKDAVTSAFGVGLGNASYSNLGRQFSGQYEPLLGKYASGGSSAGAVLLEVGLLGMACIIGLHWLIFNDSLKVARDGDDLLSVIAACWPGMVIIVTASFFYFAPVPAEPISYLFWYISGLIAAKRSQLAITSALKFRRQHEERSSMRRKTPQAA